MKLCVCLETVFVTLPVEERISRIAAAGYDAVEFWFHDATWDGKTCATSLPKDAAAVRQACESSGVTLNNVVVNAPDGSLGGSPVRADELSKYLERLEEVIDFAGQAGCHKAITCSGNIQDGLSSRQMRANLENALSRAAEIAATRQFTLLLEPLNVHVDHPGYFLSSSDEGWATVATINRPNLRLLYDVYHMQIMEGNVIATATGLLNLIGHFHSAGVPGRAELFGCELNYPEIMKRIRDAGYTGRFGLEYFPAMEDHSESLRRTREYLSQGG